jgi:hypothetical protein
MLSKLIQITLFGFECYYNKALLNTLHCQLMLNKSLGI